VIAEKTQAMVQLGTNNSRMRDFFDVYMLAQREFFGIEMLVAAIRATFERRRTEIPDGLPTALTPVFAQIPDMLTQWAGFLRKNHLSSVPEDLESVLETLAKFLEPVFQSASRNEISNSV
jgi:uncharacterized protein YfaA (DUF2138 family)